MLVVLVVMMMMRMIMMAVIMNLCQKHQETPRSSCFSPRLKRAKLGVEDFEPLKVIGKGAFGVVRLVQKVQLP